MSKVSIIVPVYNAEDNLDRLINKIQDQDYKEYELIFIDDGSTDKSKEIILNYKKNNEKIIYMSQENSGPGIARNKGLDIASGDYIIFIDADDDFKANMIADMVSYIEEYYVDIVQFPYQIIDRNNNIIDRFFDIKELKLIDDMGEALFEFARQGLLNPYLWTKIYKRESISNIRFTEHHYAEDQIFNMKVLMASEKVLVMPKSYYCYRHNPASIVNVGFNMNKLDAIRAMYEIISLLEKDYKSLSGFFQRKICRYVIDFTKSIESLDENHRDIVIDLHKEYLTNYDYYINNDLVLDNTTDSEKKKLKDFLLTIRQ